MSSPFTVKRPSAAEMAADSVKSACNNLFLEMSKIYTSNYNLVWNNRSASAADIVAAMGAEGQLLFQLSALVSQVLTTAGANAPATMPSTWTFTANDDGSVTLTPAPTPTVTPTPTPTPGVR